MEEQNERSSRKLPLQNGKSVSNLAAPWILLTLHQNPELHGYELTRIISQHIESMGMHINMGRALPSSQGT